MKDADHDLLGLPIVKTQCGNCFKVIPLVEAVISKYEITPTHTEVEHWCSTDCAEEWWANFQAKDD